MGRPAALQCAAAAALLCAAARGPARGFSAPAARGPLGRSAQGAPPGGCREEAESAVVGLAAGAVGLRAAALALAIGVAASAAAAARAADGAAPPSAERGAAVFAGNCAACHAGGNNAVQADKKLKKEALMKYGMYDASMIIYQVTNGKNAMPAFGERLGGAEITDVAAYVLSQADKGWP